MKRAVAGLLLGGLLVSLLWYLARSEARPGRAFSADGPPGVAEASAGTPGSAGVAATAATEMTLPDSLAGTSPDGALVVDADGRFLATPDAIDLFDYYLSARGEEPDARIRARIVAAIHARLRGEAARDAEDLLDAYLAYRERAAPLLGGPDLGEDLERRLQLIRELRREVFGVDLARALFEEDEARWFRDLERQRILDDPALDAAERSQRLAALEAETPEQVRTAREALVAHRELRRDEEALRAEGGSAHEIARLREERFGADAAGRLASLDAERESWRSRVAAYRAELETRIEETPDAEREALVRELRERHFEAGEILRIRALDRADGVAQPAAGS